MQILRLRQVEWTIESKNGLEVSRSPVHLAAALPIIPPVTRRGISEERHDVLEAALRIAQTIFSHTCPISDTKRNPRIHAIEFMQSSEAGNTIMSTRTFLAEVAHNGEQAWVPTALLRQQVPVLDLDEFDEIVPYDMHIFVNDGVKFAVSDSSCAFVTETEKGTQFFSATSVLLHEVLHGMGILSLGIDITFLGNDTHPNLIGTPWDNIIKDEEGNRFLPLEQTALGQHVPGKKLFVAGHSIYNPMKWQAGSSLSHFSTVDGEQDLMGHSVLPGKCQFIMPTHLIRALIAIGWPCNETTNLPGITWDNDVHYLEAEESYIPWISYWQALWVVMIIAVIYTALAKMLHYIVVPVDSAIQSPNYSQLVTKTPLHSSFPIEESR
jgi:hypothetical protein